MKRDISLSLTIAAQRSAAVVEIGLYSTDRRQPWNVLNHCAIVRLTLTFRTADSSLAYTYRSCSLLDSNRSSHFAPVAVSAKRTLIFLQKKTKS